MNQTFNALENVKVTSSTDSPYSYMVQPLNTVIAMQYVAPADPSLIEYPIIPPDGKCDIARFSSDSDCDSTNVVLDPRHAAFQTNDEQVDINLDDDGSYSFSVVAKGLPDLIPCTSAPVVPIGFVKCLPGTPTDSSGKGTVGKGTTGTGTTGTGTTGTGTTGTGTTGTGTTGTGTTGTTGTGTTGTGTTGTGSSTTNGPCTVIFSSTGHVVSKTGCDPGTGVGKKGGKGPGWTLSTLQLEGNGGNGIFSDFLSSLVPQSFLVDDIDVLNGVMSHGHFKAIMRDLDFSSSSSLCVDSKFAFDLPFFHKSFDQTALICGYLDFVLTVFGVMAMFIWCWLSFTVLASA